MKKKVTRQCSFSNEEIVACTYSMNALIKGINCEADEIKLGAE
jgi:hypothetical protein